ncbi:aspartyl-tRNA amidotransferase subunit B [Sulfurifustis variabilis]|uniref:Aspartyl-tRNA amidotransferase subunit B n=1 Tax=Sulfurifustis variabilis TaxID=1675686 RepID=A0A1B4UZZ9_9GAMM|nr:GatB/YqeY domain-containing protein [Sulfurifustis variabilis]BAU46748.1 aspartyl-tRNA amidotransferase subunit B [Sulfurifustis variabilis]
MTLKDRIKDDLKQAMRDRDQPRIDALRMLAAAIQRREVDERITLDDAQTLSVIDKQIKQARESIEQYHKGGRADLVAKEQADLALWQAYLPQPLSDVEIDRLIADAVQATGAASVKDMGKIMAILKPKLQGRADMAQVGAKVRARLGG